MMMVEARDRLARPVDIAAAFARQRSTVRGIYMDSERDRFVPSSPFRQGPAPAAIGTPGSRGLGTPSVRGRTLFGSPVVRRQNSPAGSSRRARGRSTNSALPSWYPRTPLRDITAIMRAIERRRARLREIEGQEMQISSPEASRLLDSSPTGSSAQLEHSSSSTISPISTACISNNNKPRAPPAGKIPKTLLQLANESSENSECLTPQKQLLNSIDAVEKVVKQELQKFKRTPTAKKAEREKRVRTLMSMR